jgi:hypothetical protein
MKLKYGHQLNVDIELVRNWGLQDVHLNSYLLIDILCSQLTHDYCSIGLTISYMVLFICCNFRDLSDNQFNGSISPSIWSIIPKLNVLNLSNNKLHGKLPTMKDLQYCPNSLKSL